MKVTPYQLKKWLNKYVFKTQTGFQQGIGTVYSKNEVKGYYNDLREKVYNNPNLKKDELPKSYNDNGEKFYFSIAIMQYGLACYDLYLTEENTEYLQRMLFCADWATNNQDENGGWKTFSHLYPEHPYSSMAQGEGISLLTRAYLETNDKRYIECAKRAVDFLITPTDKGGVAIENENDLFFKEYTERPVVLNGWIFSLWGLYDYNKVVNDDVTAVSAYNKTLDTLIRHLPQYDLGYWSMYDYSDRIASPQYHKLHIDQLTVMYDITENIIFNEYVEKFRKYKENFWYPKKAFIIKAIQKINGK